MKNLDTRDTILDQRKKKLKGWISGMIKRKNKDVNELNKMIVSEEKKHRKINSIKKMNSYFKIR